MMTKRDTRSKSSRVEDHAGNVGSPLHAPDRPQDGQSEPEVKVVDQKGGDRSNRAAHSGATGERGTSGRQNKPEPKDQDQKGMGRPRNR